MDDEITVPTVHLCWNDYAIRGAVEALRAAHLDIMADDMAAQLRPAVEEPELSFSVINARTSYGDRTTTLTKLGDRWVDLDGNHVGSFSSLSDVDVLRVGIGEPVPTDADAFMVQAGFAPRPAQADDWQRLDVANAQTDAHAKGVEDLRTAALRAIREERASAIDFIRRDAHDNDIKLIEGLKP